MNAFTHGMNYQEVIDTGNDLKAQAKAIHDMIIAIDRRVRDTTWVGHDADMFKNDWWPQHRAELNNIHDQLDGLGQSALNNAQAQHDVSQV